MAEKTNKEYVYFRESVFQSILSDLLTFGVMIGAFYLNYRYIGDNHFVAALILVMILLFMWAKASNRSKTFTSKQALIEHLQKGGK